MQQASFTMCTKKRFRESFSRSHRKMPPSWAIFLTLSLCCGPLLCGASRRRLGVCGSKVADGSPLGAAPRGPPPRAREDNDSFPAELSFSSPRPAQPIPPKPRMINLDSGRSATGLPLIPGSPSAASAFFPEAGVNIFHGVAVLEPRARVPLPELPSASTDGTNVTLLDSRAQRHPTLEPNFSRTVTMLESKAERPALPRLKSHARNLSRDVTMLEDNAERRRFPSLDTARKNLSRGVSMTEEKTYIQNLPSKGSCIDRLSASAGSEELDEWCWSTRPSEPCFGEHAIRRELNYCRRNPREYANEVVAPMLDDLIFEDGVCLRGKDRIRLKEGTTAIEDCIKYLKQRSEESKLGPLSWSEDLRAAAQDLVLDLGPKGLLRPNGQKHMGTDGSKHVDRIRRYCCPSSDNLTSENIHWGKDKSAEAIVRGLVVDDGVKSRGHRKTIFRSNLENVGIVVGEHGVRDFSKDTVNKLMPHIGKMLARKNNDRNAVNDWLIGKAVTPLELETIWNLYDYPTKKTNQPFMKEDNNHTGELSWNLGEAHEACRDRDYGDHGTACPFPRMHSKSYGHMCVMDFATFPLHVVKLTKFSQANKEFPAESRTILDKMFDLLENPEDRRKLEGCIQAIASKDDVEVAYTPCTKQIRIHTVEGVFVVYVPSGKMRMLK